MAPDMNAVYEAGMELVNKCKWISVEDRLPETGVDVIVSVRYANSDNVHIDFLVYNGTGEEDIEWGSYASSCVTHWMYFPEPPKG